MSTEMLAEIYFMQKWMCFGGLLWLHENSDILDKLVN